MARDMEPQNPGPHLQQLAGHLGHLGHLINPPHMATSGHLQLRHPGEPAQPQGPGHLLHVDGVGLEEQVEQVREVCEPRTARWKTGR